MKDKTQMMKNAMCLDPKKTASATQNWWDPNFTKHLRISVNEQSNWPHAARQTGSFSALWTRFDSSLASTISVHGVLTRKTSVSVDSQENHWQRLQMESFQLTVHCQLIKSPALRLIYANWWRDWHFSWFAFSFWPVSYTHLRAHETG